MRKKMMFGGKDTVKEELGEAKALKSGKITKGQYVAGEKSEGKKGNHAKKADAIKSGKMSPTAYAKGMKCGGKVKKYEEGGIIEGENANIDDDTRARAMEWMKKQQESVTQTDEPVAAKKPAMRRPMMAKKPTAASAPAPAPVQAEKPAPRKPSMTAPIISDAVGAIKRGVSGIKDKFMGRGVSRDEMESDISTPRSKRFAKGGQVRGTGAATRGKKFSGTF